MGKRTLTAKFFAFLNFAVGISLSLNAECYAQESRLRLQIHRGYGVVSLGYALRTYADIMSLQTGSGHVVDFTFDTRNVFFCAEEDIVVRQYSRLTPLQFLSPWPCFEIQFQGGNLWRVNLNSQFVETVTLRSGNLAHWCQCSEKPTATESAPRWHRHRDYLDSVQ